MSRDLRGTDGVTTVGVSFNTAPMKPIETPPPARRTAKGASSGLPCSASTTFAQT